MTDQVPYQVLGSIGDVEIRRYGPMVLATVRGLDDNSAFSLLFNYITGYNRARRKISMTAPVVSASEKIPMTAPVVSGGKSFSFAMPEGYTLETVPAPLDEKVRMEALPPRDVAVVRFRKAWSPETVDQMGALLLAKLGSAGIKAQGEPFGMRYNPPFTPWFLRRNEVGVRVEYIPPGK